MFLLVLLLLILLANSFMQKEDFSLSSYFNGELTVYAQTRNSESQILPNVSISYSKYCSVGESMYFKNLEVGNALKVLKAKVKFVENLSKLTILYCTSPLIEKTVLVKDQFINLQICIADDYAVIGWPMILGAF